MKILMLGWEFPPHFAGGLGIACYELTRSLCKNETLDITYVMPYGPAQEETRFEKLKIQSAHSFGKHVQFSLNFRRVFSTIKAYDTYEKYSARIRELQKKENGNTKKDIGKLYGDNLLEEVYLYAKRVAEIYKDEKFDIIHAHDWTSIPAALILKKLTGKPVILHVHITELDKTGNMGGDDEIFKIEQEGFANCDILVAVSNFVKHKLVDCYHVNPDKIRVIHNGGISDLEPELSGKNYGNKNKIVLFAGRITTQKGPEFFIRAAKKVLEYEKDTKFIVAGEGDLLPRIKSLCDEYGIKNNIYLLGRKYSRNEADMFFSLADIFVMPSVSEPFGIVPLEAVAKGTPTIISKQSGISEVLTHSFKVDFWDTDEMANQMISLIRYEDLHQHIRENAHNNFYRFSWDFPAEKLIKIYKEMIK